MNTVSSELRHKIILEDAIKNLRKSYATIDIRVTVARMKKGEEWQYIFCKVRLTKESFITYSKNP